MASSSFFMLSGRAIKINQSVSEKKGFPEGKPALALMNI
jgi:hypothetical protein